MLFCAILQDIRFGFRFLLARKTTSLSIIVMLALGIGANTAMFSGFEAWVLMPLDFPDPERLVLLQKAQSKLGRDLISLSAPNFGDWDVARPSESLRETVRRVAPGVPL